MSVNIQACPYPLSIQTLENSAPTYFRHGVGLIEASRRLVHAGSIFNAFAVVALYVVRASMVVGAHLDVVIELNPTRIVGPPTFPCRGTKLLPTIR